MVSNDKSICQNCGSKLKRYDKVSRIVRTKGGKTSWIEIERFRCPVCGQIHRELPLDNDLNFLLMSRSNILAIVKALFKSKQS